MRKRQYPTCDGLLAKGRCKHMERRDDRRGTWYDTVTLRWVAEYSHCLSCGADLTPRCLCGEMRWNAKEMVWQRRDGSGPGWTFWSKTGCCGSVIGPNDHVAYPPEEPEKLKPYPEWVCYDCFRQAELSEKWKNKAFTGDRCNVCGSLAVVASPKRLGYPAFAGHEPPPDPTPIVCSPECGWCARLPRLDQPDNPHERWAPWRVKGKPDNTMPTTMGELWLRDSTPEHRVSCPNCQYELTPEGGVPATDAEEAQYDLQALTRRTVTKYLLRQWELAGDLEGSAVTERKWHSAAYAQATRDAIWRMSDRYGIELPRKREDD